MDDKQLIGVSARIKLEHLAKLKAHKINFSDWVRIKLDQDFSEEEELLRERDRVDKLLILVRERKEVAQKEREIERTPALERFIKDSKKKLEDNPGFMEGRVQLFNNTFGRNINRKEFQELLDEV